MAKQELSQQRHTAAKTLRALPSVDAVVKTLTLKLHDGMIDRHSQSQLADASRFAIEQARRIILSGEATAPTLDALASVALAHMESTQRPTPQPVINATGVIINTNLGRAPLSDAALAAVAAVAHGYSALEYDLEQGERGSRQSDIRRLLRELTGAEDALAVNNNAAAILVALSALAAGREVIISRGELVEIGGGFRIPDVLRQSGARLVEVGTTNRTRAADYAAAITSETALLLSVHPSNYRIVGFTATPRLEELAKIAHQHGVLLIHDLGSGALLRTEHWGLTHEPTPQESLAAGADLVCFSGDKLLGGPQAGILAGTSEVIARLEHHPLMRAVRIDKLTLAALVATLKAYRNETAVQDIPIWRMIAAPLDHLNARVDRWLDALRDTAIAASAQQGFSTIGGGSMPGETLPTSLCAITPRSSSKNLNTRNARDGDAASQFAHRLRSARTPVVARVLRDQVLLDPRTVLPEQDDALIEAVKDASNA